MLLYFETETRYCNLVVNKWSSIVLQKTENLEGLGFCFVSKECSRCRTTVVKLFETSLVFAYVGVFPKLNRNSGNWTNH